MLGALLCWLSADHPALMPFWALWDFSPTAYLATAFALLWYRRGVTALPLDQRPAVLNRIQHVAMHHIGPFLIALGAAGGAVRCGIPLSLRRWIEASPVGAVMRIVRFRAMLDHRFYAVMNWSIVADGVLFWWLVLDPRPKPAARLS